MQIIDDRPHLKSALYSLILILALTLNLEASEWINVLDPSQRAAADTMSDQGEFKTIPDLEVVSVSGGAGDKSVKVQFKIHSVLKDAVEADGQVFDTLFVPGCGYRFDTGQPDIPAKSIFMEIPKSGSYKVSVNRGRTTQLNNIAFHPAQPLPQDNMEFQPLDFEMDRELYSKDAFFPADNIVSTREFTVRGHRMLEVVVSPLQYNPVTKTVSMAPALDVKVDISGSGSGNGVDRGGSYSDIFASGLKDFSGLSDRVQPAKAKVSELETYMILVHDSLSANPDLAEFVQWKKEKGYKVEVVTTGSVNRKMGSTDTFANSVKYLRSLPKAQYPSYLLVIGNHTKEGGIQGKYIKTYIGAYTDLPLALRDDSDYLPDLFKGRLPATTNEELSAMLKKILAMDKTPPEKGMYDRVLIAGQIQDNYKGSDGRADRLFFETGDGLASYFENHSKVSYQCTTVFENPDRMTGQGFWNAKGFLWAGETLGRRPMKRFLTPDKSVPLLNETFNQGLALVQYRAHGEPRGWGHPKWTSSHVGALKNGNLQPVVFSVTCLTGAFHKKDNFSKKLLTHEGGGAYGVISSVDVSYSWTNDMFVHGLYAAFLEDYISSQRSATTPGWTKKLSHASLFKEGSAKRLGPILNAGLLYLYEHFNMRLTPVTFELFHLFGDPESYLRFHRPKAFTPPKLPAALQADRKNSVVLEGLEPGTLVSLYGKDPKMGIHTARVSQNRKTVFEVLPKAPGTITVTLSRHDRIPFQAQIKVGATAAQPSNVKEKSFIEVIEPTTPKKRPASPQNDPPANNDDSEYKSVF